MVRSLFSVTSRIKTHYLLAGPDDAPTVVLIHGNVSSVPFWRPLIEALAPLAKKIAQDKGINLSQVKGSGENGRIVKSDVENFSPSAVATPTQAVAEATNAVAAVKPFVPAGEVFQEEIKNSQMRKTIARRLSESKFTAPHYY